MAIPGESILQQMRAPEYLERHCHHGRNSLPHGLGTGMEGRLFSKIFVVGDPFLTTFKGDTSKTSPTNILLTIEKIHLPNTLSNAGFLSLLRNHQSWTIRIKLRIQPNT